MSRQLFEFGPYRLDPQDRSLWRGEERIPLAGAEFEILNAMLRRAGQLASKSMLLKEVWPDAHLSMDESNVYHAMMTLRRKLGKDAAGREFVRTVPNRGYFVPDVIVRSREAEAELASPAVERFQSEGDFRPTMINGPHEPSHTEGDHDSEEAASARREISPPDTETDHVIMPASTDPVRRYIAVSAVAIVYAIAAVGVIWPAYGMTVGVFWLGAIVIALVYRRLPNTPTTRSVAALFLLAAMSYTTSATTLPEVMSTVENLDVIPPAAAYPLVMGLEYIPLFFVVLAYWVPFAYRRDKGLPASPLLSKAYILSGILVSLVTCVCVVLASGEDHIWQANLPGRWLIVLGGAVVFVFNVAAWIVGHYYYKKESIASYWPLFLICTMLYLPVAVTAFLVDGQFNRINQYYLDVRWPEAYVAGNPDAANDVESLLRGVLKAKVGLKLQSVLRDPAFRQMVQHGTFYKQHFDEPFQVFDRAVIMAYRRASQAPHGRLPLVVIRFPKELADAFRFEVVSEDR